MHGLKNKLASLTSVRWTGSSGSSYLGTKSDRRCLPGIQQRYSVVPRPRGYKYTTCLDIGIRFKAANMAQIAIHLPSYVS